MNTAIVKIWGREVGAVAWDERTGVASFEYTPAFKALGWELAPLKMPLTREQKIYSFPELRKERDSSYDTFKGLPGLLADMLPDRYGGELINLWLAQQGRPENSMNPVEMLCFIGQRGMGALEFEPAIQRQNVNTFSVEVDSLVEIAGKMLSQKEHFVTNLNSDEEKAVREILKIGTSAGGARPKAVIAYNEKTGEIRSGQTRAPEGFEHWLLKLDGVSEVQLGATHGFGRVEYAYYLMATDCGIEMTPCRLLEENGRAHFMTKRFDRDGSSTKHHTQTFCAMKHFDYNRINSYSYEQLFQTMRELKLTYAEAEQMFRRMVFNVVARNCDDHTKNFTFILKQGGHWELAPAYDVCHAYRPGSEWVSHHALSINGKRDNITREDLMIIGKSIRNKKSKELKYYSSECEVEFCGHGTIACIYELIRSNDRLKGLQEITITTNKGDLKVYNELQQHDAVFITAPDPQYLIMPASLNDIAGDLGISQETINKNYPIELIDAGLRTLIVPINSIKDMLEIAPNEMRLKEFCLFNSIDIILVFTEDVVNEKNKVRTRVFAPKFGYLEDPATGSGNSALGYYMLKNNLWDGKAISIEQNAEIDNFNVVKLKTVSNKVLFGGSGITKIEGLYYLS